MTFATLTQATLAAAGLSLVLGSGASALENATADALPALEIAPGSAVRPLEMPRSRRPAFVLIHRIAATSTDIAVLSPANMPLSVGTSGLLAFDSEGVRLPAYEADIPTGTVAARPVGRR